MRRLSSTERGRPRFAIDDWLDGNADDLAWLVLLIGGLVFFCYLLDAAPFVS